MWTPTCEPRCWFFSPKCFLACFLPMGGGDPVMEPWDVLLNVEANLRAKVGVFSFLPAIFFMLGLAVSAPLGGGGDGIVGRAAECESPNLRAKVVPPLVCGILFLGTALICILFYCPKNEVGNALPVPPCPSLPWPLCSQTFGLDLRFLCPRCRPPTASSPACTCR